MNRPSQSAQSYGYNKGQVGVESASQSAKVIVPILCEKIRPRSVIDIGCGVGDWLSEFLKNGIEIVKGYDGDWVPRDNLIIPHQLFYPLDFYSKFPKEEKFDLAICLEVVEHVSMDVSEKILDFMCMTADVIFFSAAVPGQGGYEHINEQFQDFWIDQFKVRGFTAYDYVRPKIWMNEKVSFYYQQNGFIFANSRAKLKLNFEEIPFISKIIHPFLYQKASDPKMYSIKNIFTHIPFYLKRTINNYLFKN